MQALLLLSHAIDRLNAFVGKWVIWLILACTVISGVNAFSRRFLGLSSNAWLEIQWYLFAATFMLAAGYTLLHQEHVKIDVLYGKLSKRAQTWIDIMGFALFLTPMCLILIYLGWPLFVNKYSSGEMSGSSGGLILWPVYALIPIGFALLMLQGWSELIKRVAFLMGLIEDPTAKHGEKSAEEELAEAIRNLAGDKTDAPAASAVASK